MVVEIKGNIINPLNNYFPKIDVINSIDNVTDNGIYLLASSSDSTPKLKLYTDKDNMDTHIGLYPFNYYVGDHNLGNFTVNWGDGTIETFGEYDEVVHNYSNQDEYVIEIDWFDGATTIENSSGYDTGFGFDSNIYKIELPYGITSLVSGNLYFNGSKLSIPKTVTSISSDLFSDDRKTYILHWDTADTILQNIFAENSTFSIPYGTTALYTAKGYPSNSLIEREEEISTNSSVVSELYIKKGDNEIYISNDNETEINDNLDLLLLSLTEEISKL